MSNAPSLSAPSRVSRVQRLAPLFVSALVALLIYGATIRGTYIYDDIPVALDDVRLSRPSLWLQYLTREYMAAPDKLYRPLVSLSFAIQRTLSGDGAWQFHLVNILLNAAVAAAVAELAYRLAGLRVAWIAGILFAVHPAHVEAVAGIVGRCELACALATLCGLCALLRRPMSGWRIGFICLCCAMAVLSKEQGLFFLLLVLALLPFRMARTEAEPAERKRVRALIACICYITAGYIVLREYTVGFWWDRVFLSWEMNPLVRSRGIDSLLMPIQLIGRYLVLLIAPHRLSVDYGAYAIGWTVRWPNFYLALGFGVIIAWFVAVIWAWRRKAWAAFFCLVALALTYGMIGNLVALIGTIFADRLIYLPSAFFLILIGMALARLRPAAALPLVIVLALVGGWRAIDYARAWNSPRQLYALCVRNQPGSERAYDLLYTELKHEGRWAEAREVGRAAVQAVPDADRPYAMCIESDLALGDREDARKIYDRGVGACSGFDKLFLIMAGGKLLDPSHATTQASP